MTSAQRDAAAEHLGKLCRRTRALGGPEEVEVLLTAAAYALEGEVGPHRARLIVKTLDVIRGRFEHLQETL